MRRWLLRIRNAQQQQRSSYGSTFLRAGMGLQEQGPLCGHGTRNGTRDGKNFKPPLLPEELACNMGAASVRTWPLFCSHSNPHGLHATDQLPGKERWFKVERQQRSSYGLTFPRAGMGLQEQGLLCGHGTRGGTNFKVERMSAPSSVATGALRKYDDPVATDVRANASMMILRRNLKILKVFSREKMAEERAKLHDEMARGYFLDFKELKANGGKLGMAPARLLPMTSSIHFPPLSARAPDGSTFVLPLSRSEGNNTDSDVTTGVASAREHRAAMHAPVVTVITLSFRASAQAMANSWITPFTEAFQVEGGDRIHLYEVSFVEPWLLSLSPIQNLLLRIMKTSSSVASSQEEKPLGDRHPSTDESVKGAGDGITPLLKRTLYSFGDTYHLRKTLTIHNRLTAYVLILDKAGRVRWKATGMASPEELSWMMNCTKCLLEES